MALFPFPMFDPLIAVQRSLNQLTQDLGNFVTNQAQPQVGYYRPWRHTPSLQSGISKVLLDKDNFQIELDVQQFSPNEISVKTVDNYIVVEGKHEEKEDEHGFITRHFVRRYAIPSSVKAESLNSTLSADGLLTISAPVVPALPAGKERPIPIVATGTPDKKEITNK